LTEMPLTYDAGLILLSIIVIFISSFIALNISGTLFRTTGKTRWKWLSLGALVMGLGIWSMHFIGMLASQMAMPVTYNKPLVILSILPALVASGLAFAIISKPHVRKLEVIVGAIFITTGIVSMHYTGMAAMQMQATIEYNPFLWGMSVVIALVASLVAMLLLFYSRDRSGFFWLKIASAVFITIGVAGMHYTGMAAARFVSMDHLGDVSGGALDSSYIAFNVGGGMVLILLAAVLSLRSDKKVKSITDEYTRQFQSVIESATDGIVVIDSQQTVVQWNRGAENLFGYTKEEIEQQDIRTILPKEETNLYQTDFMSTDDKVIELTGVKKNGSRFPLELTSGHWETESDQYCSMIIRDITERRTNEARISNLVYLDSLTGLPNRRLFHDRVQATIDQAKEEETVFTILYLDLDQFKLVNDTYSHRVGDELLIEAAKRIESCIPKTDTLARLSGDEFTILLQNIDYKEAQVLAHQILEAFNQQFVLKDEAVFITLSIGASVFPINGKETEELMQNASISMNRVKEEGKNNVQFYTHEMNKSLSRKSKIALSIREGLERKEFSVHYQPQIDIATERIVGVEALVRWHHPTFGMISPAEFIPIAEESGMILNIGDFVLRTACHQNKAWQDAGLDPFRVAVNISAKQFSQPNMAEIVTAALHESKLAPKYLELELTESIIQEAALAIAKMDQLKAMGIHLSIDDFGTGYSSLSYLKLFPVDTLKIDQYFTRNIQTDAKDAALVDTIIQMARNLDLNVIAEGVETIEQLAFLKAKGCHQAQGYYFQKPLVPERITELYATVR